VKPIWIRLTIAATLWLWEPAPHSRFSRAHWSVVLRRRAWQDQVGRPSARHSPRQGGAANQLYCLKPEAGVVEKHAAANSPLTWGDFGGAAVPLVNEPSRELYTIWLGTLAIRRLQRGSPPRMPRP